MGAHDLFEPLPAVARGVGWRAGEQQADPPVPETGEMVDRFRHRLHFVGENRIDSIEMARHVIDADQRQLVRPPPFEGELLPEVEGDRTVKGTLFQRRRMVGGNRFQPQTA